MRYGIGILSIAMMLATSLVWADDPALERKRLNFFESKIRPVLIKNCYECHATDSKKISGGLLVDSRQGLLEGGESGPAVVPGNLKESLLVSALKYDAFEMPPTGMLSPEIIADFEKWIRDGAIDPRRGAGYRSASRRRIRRTRSLSSQRLMSLSMLMN